MMHKYETRAESPDASEDEDASRAIAEGKALTAGNYAAARAAFEEGKAAAKAAGDDFAVSPRRRASRAP